MAYKRVLLLIHFPMEGYFIIAFVTVIIIMQSE